MLGTESLDEPFRLRVKKLTSPTLPWAKPHPNHVFQTPPVFLPTVSALMVQVSRPHLNQRTATCDAKFDRRRRSAGCAAPGVCALDTGDEIAGCGGSAHGRSVDVIRAGQPTPKQVSELREDELCNGAIRVAIATSFSQCGCRLRSAPRCCCSSQSRASRAPCQTSEAAQSSCLSFRLAD